MGVVSSDFHVCRPRYSDCRQVEQCAETVIWLKNLTNELSSCFHRSPVCSFCMFDHRSDVYRIPLRLSGVAQLISVSFYFTHCYFHFWTTAMLACGLTRGHMYKICLVSPLAEVDPPVVLLVPPGSSMCSIKRIWNPAGTLIRPRLYTYLCDSRDGLHTIQRL